MRKSIGSFAALNRRAILLFGVVLSLTVFSIVTWRISAQNKAGDSPGDGIRTSVTTVFPRWEPAKDVAAEKLSSVEVLSSSDAWTGTLSGASEVPPNVSTATGSAVVSLSGNTLTVSETFSGLIGGNASAAHIHCCAPAGTNTGVAVPFTGFPAATSGTYNQTFDLTFAATYNSTFLTNNGGTAASTEAAFLAGLDASQAYANIHNATFPGGEIRAQLVPAAAPV